jgi:hypothetical protein
MAQTYADIQTQVLFDDFDASRYRSAAKQAILDAIGEVARQVRLPANETSQTLTLTSGTANYSVPAGVRLTEVYDSGVDQTLSEVSEEWLDTQPDSTGRPVVFALYGSSLTLYPTPDSATYPITVRYLKQGSVPVNDNDQMAAVTGIPEDYLHGLVEYARARLFRYEDDPDMSAFWDSRWQDTLRKLKGDLQRRNTGRRRQIPGMFAAQPGPRFARPA